MKIKDKQAEINNFCKTKKKLYTTETIRKFQLELELEQYAEYRRKLYDWCINGRLGRKPQK